jgi:hypothetical protein
MKENDEEKAPTLPANFRQRPSRNQKQRSKLKQAPESLSAPEAPPPVAPTPPPAVSQSTPPPSLKKARMKRSGQMHEDLTAPLPEEPEKKETEY